MRTLVLKMKLKLILVLSLTLLFISACSQKRKVTVSGTKKSDILEASKQPIYSVNLIKKEIPETLKDLKVVYQAPKDCAEYKQELLLLDSVLGEDLIDKADEKNKKTTVNLGKAIGKQVESTIPFNSVIKSLSGAKKHEKARLSAFIRGQSRRSYLKGWAAARDCQTKD